MDTSSSAFSDARLQAHFALQLAASFLEATPDDRQLNLGWSSPLNALAGRTAAVLRRLFDCPTCRSCCSIPNTGFCGTCCWKAGS